MTYETTLPGITVDVTPCKGDGWSNVIPAEVSTDPGEVKRVHVMSKWAGGEVRSYWLCRGRLWLAAPCYTGTWTEVDAAVSAALGASVVPNTITAGGAVLYLPDVKADAVGQVALFPALKAARDAERAAEDAASALTDDDVAWMGLRTVVPPAWECWAETEARGGET